MSLPRLATSIFGALFGLMLAGAIFSHSILHRSPLDGKGSAAFLFIAGAFVLAGSTDRWRLLAVGGLGYVAEVVGVRYGWLFGKYEYTDVLDPGLFGAPVAMVFAWLILLGYGEQITKRLGAGRFSGAFLVAALLVVIDAVIDPLASNQLGFWKWRTEGGYYGVPLRNFFGWYVVSLVICLADRIVFRGERSGGAVEMVVGVGVILMYTVAAWVYGYWIPGVVGSGWLVLSVVLGKMAGSGAAKKSHAAN